MEATKIPSAASIDYTDPQAVCAYQRRAAELYDLAGGFLLTSTHTAAPGLSKADCKALQRQIRKEGETWLTGTRHLIDTLLQHPDMPKATTHHIEEKINQQEAEKLDMRIIAELLDAYDIYSRIASGIDGRIATPAADYVRNIRLRLFDRWLKGNKTLTRQQLAAMIGQEIARDPRTLSPRHLHFYFDTQASLQPSKNSQPQPTIYW